MDIEKLEKGKKVLKYIADLTEEKEKWKSAQGIYEISVIVKGFFKDDAVKVDPHFISFDILKHYAISVLRNRIIELQKQFDEL